VEKIKNWLYFELILFLFDLMVWCGV